MRVLELDFAGGGQKRARAGALLLLIGAVSVFVLISAFEDLQRENTLLQQELERIDRRARGLSTVTSKVDDATVAEIRLANSVIDQLTLPWGRLFRAIEGASFGKVVLIGITPDSRSRSVEITGEATDREAMIDYVQRLASDPALSNVYLLSDQYDRRGGARPYRFTVSGSWLGAS